MSKIFSSFYARLSILFLLLLLVLGTIHILISIQSSINYVEEADQRLNTDLAGSIALEFDPFLKDSLNMAGIEHMMHYLMVMNPHIEIYLLDSTGHILAFFAEPAKKVRRERVSLGPIHGFIESDIKTPVQGDDPRNADRQKPFSAAPIKLSDGSDGFIYVILGGEQYDYATASIREDFLTSTALKGLGVSLLFTAIIGLVLIFFMTRRLRAVTEVVTEFKDGNYDRRLPEKSNDDFGQLSRAFNRMADTIVGNMDQLKKTDDLRRELIANVSHDLRSPLASIQGYLETIKIKRRDLSPEELEKYIDISLGNARDLNRMVAELFELSKLDARQIEPHMESFSVSELVQDVVMKFKPTADQKQIVINAQLGEPLPQVRGDIGMIERVLSNLMENAIKYSPERSDIEIIPVRANGSIRVAISDHGSGIAEEDLPRIFSRYFRGTRTGAKSRPGTGLGLAISKKIMELHDSDIVVESKPNSGSTFSFDLSIQSN